MRTLVLYKSNTGNTEAYAEKIANALHAEAVPFKKGKFNKMNLDDYDTIVFGGWIMGSQIQGIDDFLGRWDDMSSKNVIVFAVGMSFASKESRDNLISANLLDMYHLRFYQLRGGFDYSKLGPIQKLMFNIGISQTKKETDGKTDLEFLQRIKETPFEFSDDAGLSRIIYVLRTIEDGAGAPKAEPQEKPNEA